MNERMRERERK